MKDIKYYILALMTVTLLVACHDDDDYEGQEIDFCVRAAWLDGLSGGQMTRALTASNLLANGTSDISIGFDDYPSTINVQCKKDDAEVLPLTLTKGTAPCGEHTGYWDYTPSFLFRDQLIKREDYKFYASATIDGGDVLEGTADKTDIDGIHLKLTLHHTKALVRFAFKVDARYDKIRYIRLTGIELNGSSCFIINKVLNKDNLTLIGYAYVDPAVVTVSHENTIKCSYNIYDKDAVFPTESMTQDEVSDAETELLKHLDRAGVVAQNKFKLNQLKDAGGNVLSKISAGYYYDLKVTLNPDYLYVLSEHDNKHITIN